MINMAKFALSLRPLRLTNSVRKLHQFWKVAKCKSVIYAFQDQAIFHPHKCLNILIDIDGLFDIWKYVHVFIDVKMRTRASLYLTNPLKCKQIVKYIYWSLDAF
jgi:hypothetical protein